MRRICKLVVIAIALLGVTAFVEDWNDGTPGVEAATSQSVTLQVDAKANVFGAGKPVPPAPGGGGGGILPPSISFPTGSAQFVTFPSVGGQVSCCSGNFMNDADGGFGCCPNDPTNITSYDGISGIRNDRRMFLVGVFLGDTSPVDPAPAVLDFTGATSFLELRPVIAQTFFIGDGLTGHGTGEIQRFYVPPTATRLFLGFADAAGSGPPGYYDDNVGLLDVSVQLGATVVGRGPAKHAVIFLGGIDSSASCTNGNDDLDTKMNAVRDYVLSAQQQLLRPIFQRSDFIEFNWRGGGRCPLDPAQVEYDSNDTCVGVDEGAKRLDALIKSLPPNATVDLIGHSLGGIVAAYWASKQPLHLLQARVHSVITLDSPLKGAPDPQGWFWKNIFTSCPDNSGSVRDLRLQTDVIPSLVRSSVTTSEPFAAVICTPAGANLLGSWKVIRRNVVFDHDCAWKRDDTRALIALSLFETLVDDRQPNGTAPRPHYVSGWIQNSDDRAAEDTTHSTRSTGREIRLNFDGGEIVLLYEGSTVCSELYCAYENAPLVGATVDGSVVLDRFRTDCLAITRCQRSIASGLNGRSHRLIVTVQQGSADVYFQFDGFSVCPRSKSGKLVLAGLPCGYTEWN